MLVALFASLTGLAGPCRAADDPEVPSPALRAAERASHDGRFKDARPLLEAIVASPSVRAEDRDAAAQELARIAWRIDGKPDAARKRLEKIAQGARKKVPPLLLQSRMERTLGRFEAAQVAARRALAAAGTNAERRSATIALCSALVEEEVEVARLGKRKAFGNESRRRLTEALGLLAPLVRDEPGLLEPSKTALDAALLLSDGPAALAAWRSYYLAAGAADSTLLTGPRAVLAERLPVWMGPAAGRRDREAVVEALVGSRFFTEAVILAKDPRTPREARVDRLPGVMDLVLYESFIRDVRETTEHYYRDIARGTSDPETWMKTLRTRARRLWNGLSWPSGRRPPFDEKVLEHSADTELGTRFGTAGGAGTTGGYRDLHMGHRVVDEERVADQYGRRAVIRFMALDAIVSNGYETWMWDGQGAHGGWGGVGLVVQVRPAYAGGGPWRWQEMTDPERRAKALAKMAKETERDRERALKDPYAYLPGLSQRLLEQGLLRILDQEKARGLSGGALRSAFVAETDRAVIESSIFAHEGRHAIDSQFEDVKDPATREYRAKLSEIAFAPAPRLAFGGILTDGIGNPTPHGQANLKLMKGLVAWMGAHRAEIAGFDAGAPTLPQLDKLTDEQLRAAARSLDPMAATVPAD
ncbi:MAG: hypothetical protein ACHQJD_05605 [Thermoanaerobaculia bacterium]